MSNLVIFLITFGFLLFNITLFFKKYILLYTYVRK